MNCPVCGGSNIRSSNYDGQPMCRSCLYDFSIHPQDFKDALDSNWVEMEEDNVENDGGK